MPGNNYLDHGFATNQMSAASNGNTSKGAVDNLFTTLYQLAHVTEPGGTIGIGE